MLMTDRSEETYQKLKEELSRLRDAVEHQRLVVEGNPDYGFSGLKGRIETVEKLMEEYRREMQQANLQGINTSISELKTDIAPLKDAVVTIKSLKWFFGAFGLTVGGVLYWIASQLNG